MRLIVEVNRVVEILFLSVMGYGDPYNAVDMEVLFTTPAGPTISVPAFWDGDNTWKVRFAASEIGEYPFEARASNAQDTGLNGQRGTVTVTPYTGDNPLFRSGRIRVASDKHHFERGDGTPFFWMGDTWWMGLSTRLDWPQGFKELAADRVAKGFNVVQIVAGPYPDMPAWDERGKNEAGFPFAPDYTAVNPAYFDHADLKIAHLVESGLMPCIVGMWGYYLPQIGEEKVKRFWRYLVARYGAYPVAWCICGEGMMPWYLSKTPEADRTMQQHGWSEVMKYVRAVDPYHNLISIHPTHYGRDQVDDPALMDFEMLQTGHGDMDSVSTVIESVCQAVDREPAMPVVNSEIDYEGILGRCWQNVQRLCFYHTVMNGAAGYTYGANGIWQMNTPETPYGPSPHGRCWGNTPWQEAMKLPGGRQIALGAAFLSRYPWWECRRHPEWIDASKTPNDPYGRAAMGIPNKLRIIYAPMCWDAPEVKSLEAGVAYTACYVNPCTGLQTDLGKVHADADGNWTPPFTPEVHDWLLVLQASTEH